LCLSRSVCRSVGLSVGLSVGQKNLNGHNLVIVQPRSLKFYMEVDLDLP
jgi:hypothetical protein